MGCPAGIPLLQGPLNLGEVEDRPKSCGDFRFEPSATFAGTDTAARLSWEIRPKRSSSGRDFVSSQMRRTRAWLRLQTHRLGIEKHEPPQPFDQLLSVHDGHRREEDRHGPIADV